eukprot:3774731-Rhodomonas_salina.1
MSWLVLMSQAQLPAFPHHHSQYLPIVNIHNTKHNCTGLLFVDVRLSASRQHSAAAAPSTSIACRADTDTMADPSTASTLL